MIREENEGKMGVKIFKNMKNIERMFYYEIYNATYNITAVVPAKAAAI